MAPRANWKGFLKVAELTCPVALYTAAFVEIGQASLANAGLQGPAQQRLAISDVRTDPASARTIYARTDNGRVTVRYPT